ncbi:hypothetical protein PHYPO_G00113400 [Pangasianodon hypophthalmus]|uniref:Uncharacterized protein n=1 Tax=Pangasianodon hypophthalmus TaxID=310915 RepID=A0A5N5L2N9_PANHP|nr:hypothetical protein PHYPO_G00113400 [Pangasianodon hypophthalmus]
MSFGHRLQKHAHVYISKITHQVDFRSFSSAFCLNSDIFAFTAHRVFTSRAPLFVCSRVQALCAARYCGDVLQMSSDARGGARDVAIALSTASSRRSWCHAEKHNRSRRLN